MKILNRILSALTVVFAALGLLQVLPFAVATSLALTFLASTVVVRGLEIKRSIDKWSSLLIALFVYGVVIYTVFIS